MFTMHPNYRPFTLSDVLVHYITPLMALADWLLFDPKGRYRWFHPFAWLSLPLAYQLFAVIRAPFITAPTPSGSRYPYLFIDIDALGWGVVLWPLGMAAGLVALGYALYGINHLLGRLATRAQAHKAST